MRRKNEKHPYIVSMSNNLLGARRDLSEFKELLNCRNNFTFFCKTNYKWVEMFVILRLLMNKRIFWIGGHVRHRAFSCVIFVTLIWSFCHFSFNFPNKVFRLIAFMLMLRYA